ncbi:hypothetical protein [Pseudonocardia spinosispora]|uniref:hypothetical protein n=1 Tax=Pseudonocardia spinosispora TaxID=103441 RepID=UPI0012ECBA1E|nr:hypothetical protein [Pseudonocardia spinosispora]
MNRRVRATVLNTVLATVLTVLLGVLAGCLVGCSGGNDRLPNADDPVAWADRVCAALGPLASMKGHAPEFNRNDPAASRDAMSRYFADTADRAGQSIEGLDLAGPSPIVGGDDAASKLRGALQRTQAAYSAARDKVDRVDPSDPVGMGTQLPGILVELAKSANDPDLHSLGANSELNDAVKQAKSCSLVGSAGAPSDPN